MGPSLTIWRFARRLEILQQNADTYRRLRNTLRYMLGALDGFSAAESVPDVTSFPELETWVLHRLTVLDETVHRCCKAYDFHTLLAELTSFCVNDLSAFYFDIRKDLLYCGHPRSLERRACRTVLDRVFRPLCDGWRRFCALLLRRLGCAVTPRKTVLFIVHF